jgi:PAS domain-containing protein
MCYTEFVTVLQLYAFFTVGLAENHADNMPCILCTSHGNQFSKEVWRNKTGKITAVQLSGVVRRRSPHHKPSKFPARSAPERAVKVPCANKIDFRVHKLCANYLKKQRNLVMDLNIYFKSIIEQDRCSVVICNTEHEIIYMNPAASKKYAKWGGNALIGKNLLDCHKEKSVELICRILAWFKENPEHNCVHFFYNERENRDVYMIALRKEDGTLIGYYEKHEYRTRETGNMGIPSD